MSIYTCEYEINPEITGDLNNWKEQHGNLSQNFRKYYESAPWPNQNSITPWPLNLTEKNMDSIFISIYSFREIVLKIDNDIMKMEVLKTKRFYNEKRDSCIRQRINYLHLIDQWDKCEYTGFTITEIEKLGIKLIDIYRIKYMKYMAFIYTLLTHEKIIFSYECTEDII